MLQIPLLVGNLQLLPTPFLYSVQDDSYMYIISIMLARLHVVNALHCGANLGVYSRYCCRNDTPRKHWLQQLCQTACRNSSVLANKNIFKPCVDCWDPMMLAVRVPVMHTFCQTVCRSRCSQCFAAGCCIPDAQRCSISKVAHVDELTTCHSWI